MRPVGRGRAHTTVGIYSWQRTYVRVATGKLYRGAIARTILRDRIPFAKLPPKTMQRTACAVSVQNLRSVLTRVSHRTHTHGWVVHGCCIQSLWEAWHMCDFVAAIKRRQLDSVSPIRVNSLSVGTERKESAIRAVISIIYYPRTVGPLCSVLQYRLQTPCATLAARFNCRSRIVRLRLIRLVGWGWAAVKLNSLHVCTQFPPFLFALCVCALLFKVNDTV